MKFQHGMFDFHGVVERCRARFHSDRGDLISTVTGAATRCKENRRNVGSPDYLITTFNERGDANRPALGYGHPSIPGNAIGDRRSRRR